MTLRARVIGYIPLDGQKAKRTRISKLLDVTRAKSNGDRQKKLSIAVKEFDHNDTKSHDRDIKDGAVAIICSLLRSCTPFDKKEIRSCISILLSLYRCSDERLCASFCTDASTLILDLLELIEIHYRLGRKGDAKCLVLGQRVVETLATGARVPLARVKQHEFLLATLVGNINGATGRFVMHLSMKIVANLSECSQNKQVMFAFPSLLDSIAVGTGHMDESVRDESARIIMNLALESKNKTLLIQGSHKNWLDAIVSLARGSSVSKAQAFSIKTLGYLGLVAENKIIMVKHDEGAVIDTLLRVVSSHASQSLRVNAARIIGSLACQATASRIGRHPELLVSLSSLACRDDRLSATCAMTLKKLATYVRSGDECHAPLLRALVTASFGRSTEALRWILKAYAEQASYPRDRRDMISHPGMLTSLIALTNDEDEFVRAHAREVLGALAYDVANAKNTSVEKVLHSVYASNSCDYGKRSQPRCYSPSSVAGFDFDFAACDFE